MPAAAAACLILAFVLVASLANAAETIERGALSSAELSEFVILCSPSRHAPLGARNTTEELRYQELAARVRKNPLPTFHLQYEHSYDLYYDSGRDTARMRTRAVRRPFLSFDYRYRNAVLSEFVFPPSWEVIEPPCCQTPKFEPAVEGNDDSERRHLFENMTMTPFDFADDENQADELEYPRVQGCNCGSLSRKMMMTPNSTFLTEHNNNNNNNKNKNIAPPKSEPTSYEFTKTPENPGYVPAWTTTCVLNNTVSDKITWRDSDRPLPNRTFSALSVNNLRRSELSIAMVSSASIY